MRVAFIVFTGLCVAFSVLLPRIDESLRVHRALTGISEAGGIWKVLSDTDLQANYTSKPEFSSTPVRQTQVLALPQVAKSSAAIEQLREAGGVDALELDISQLSPGQEKVSGTVGVIQLVSSAFHDRVVLAQAVAASRFRRRWPRLLKSIEQ